ncbi:DUF2158 domain-containing protein [Dongshaea marina]|uniref:DUF2158 domain-containing protein n=1 Tax=Dongshaea marina TaxID=2047966 RepID=UPI000D3ECAE4|nr:DUF2158 domain-containing protein [Dongshaea marina]
MSSLKASQPLEYYQIKAWMRRDWPLPSWLCHFAVSDQDSQSLGQGVQVRLKQGGPIMVIVEDLRSSPALSSRNAYVECAWLDSTGQVCRDYFVTRQLTRIEDQPPGCLNF